MPDIHLTGDAPADELLSRDPLALLFGMMLDQQIPMEKAFRGPEVLRQRLGHDLDAHELAERTDLPELFAVPPAIHRFPGAMAKRTQELARHLVERYGGDAEALWSGVTDARDLLARLNGLPGFGDQKARIFLALLAKQYGVRPDGWREAAGDYGRDGARSVADVRGPDSLQAVRAHKKSVKAANRAAASTTATASPAPGGG